MDDKATWVRTEMADKVDVHLEVRKGKAPAVKKRLNSKRRKLRRGGNSQEEEEVRATKGSTILIGVVVLIKLYK